MAEDLFEKARKAFFETAAPTPILGVTLIECLKPQGSPGVEEPLQDSCEEPMGLASEACEF